MIYPLLGCIAGTGLVFNLAFCKREKNEDLAKEQISFSLIKGTPTSFVSYMDALAKIKNNSISSLILEENNFDENSDSFLSKVCQKIRTNENSLKILSLKKTILSKIQANNIIKAVSTNKNLSEVHLENCGITMDYLSLLLSKSPNAKEIITNEQEKSISVSFIVDGKQNTFNRVKFNL